MKMSAKGILPVMFILALSFLTGYFGGCGKDPLGSNQLPSVNLTATPASGNIPLTVNFTANASDSDGSVVKYEWDFDNNGVFDSTTTGNSVNYIYNTPGTFTPKVRVTDNSGSIADATTQVSVNQGIIHFTSSGIPSNNSVYLEEVSTSNDVITLAVKIQGGVDVFGTALEITFNDSKIRFISAAQGSYINQGGEATIFSAGLEQGNNGILLIGIDRQGNASGVNGDGVLCQVVLKALAAQANTAVEFNPANSGLKSPNGNISGTSFLGGSFSYQ